MLGAAFHLNPPGVWELIAIDLFVGTVVIVFEIGKVAHAAPGAETIRRGAYGRTSIPEASPWPRSCSSI